MKYSADYLLKNALKTNETPDKSMVERVKHGTFGREFVPKRRYHFRVLTALATTFLLVATIFASVYLTSLLPLDDITPGNNTPGIWAEIFASANPTLGAAFDSSRAIIINESVIEGDYIYTLHAILHHVGKEFTPYPDSQTVTSDDRTYYLASVKRIDGTPEEIRFGAGLIFKDTFPKLEGYQAPMAYEAYADGINYEIFEGEYTEELYENKLYFGLRIVTEDIKMWAEYVYDPDNPYIMMDLNIIKNIPDPTKLTKLSAELVSKVIQDERLRDAFMSDDVIVINKSVTAGEYIFTLHALVLDLDFSRPSDFNSFHSIKYSYVLASAQRVDGSPGLIEFGTLVRGKSLVELEQYPNDTIRLSGAERFVEVDGITYTLLECVNIDQNYYDNLYFLVHVGSPFFDMNTVIYDSLAGEFMVKPEYSDNSVVITFSIFEPIDTNTYSGIVRYIISNYENFPALGAAFDSNRAVVVEKSVTYGDYKFTLHAAVSGGKEISLGDPDMPYFKSDERTFVLGSIEKINGSKDFSFGNFVFVKGSDGQVVHLDKRGVVSPEYDGVRYFVWESDSVEIFADWEIYVGMQIYKFDEKTMVLNNHPDYPLVTIELPLDPSLADPVEANAYLKKMADFNDKLYNQTIPEGAFIFPADEFSWYSMTADDQQRVYDFLAATQNWTPDESTRKVLTVENGMVEFDYFREGIIRQYVYNISPGIEYVGLLWNVPGDGFVARGIQFVVDNGVITVVEVYTDIIYTQEGINPEWDFLNGEDFRIVRDRIREFLDKTQNWIPIDSKIFPVVNDMVEGIDSSGNKYKTNINFIVPGINLSGWAINGETNEIEANARQITLNDDGTVTAVEYYCTEPLSTFISPAVISP